jgi:hypothetical protein
MEWNLGALITLGLAVIGSIIWIIRLESKVTILEKELSGERGIFKTLERIENKLSFVGDSVIEMKTKLNDLIIDHDRNKSFCSNYKSESLE